MVEFLYLIVFKFFLKKKFRKEGRKGKRGGGEEGGKV